jgi:hypothetical protein
MYDMTYVKIKHSNVDSNLDCEGDSHQTASGGGEATDTDIVIAPDTTDPDATDVSPYSILPTDEEREIIVNDALEEIIDIMSEQALDYKREDFSNDTVEDTVYGYLCQYFSELDAYRSDYSKATSAEADALNEVLEMYIQELYNEIVERFYEEVAPPRSYPNSFIRDTKPLAGSGGDADTDTDADAASAAADIDRINAITSKLDILRAKPQPEQRTPEWYLRRNNLITASAASKAFGTPASVNQLIYEKCKNYAAPPTVIPEPETEVEAEAETAINDSIGGEADANKDTHKIIITASAAATAAPTPGAHNNNVSVNSPLHWGQRYEPITAMLYEYRNKTKLGEFGCIAHDTHPFIGASPDGINVDPTSALYGRMVEIKNIVNREITGIPKEEYWIQTQIQMEVCDIDETDFVETRIKEYADEEEFLADSPSDAPASRNYTANGREKGVILWFQPPPTKNPNPNCSGLIYSMPLYEYAPLGISQEEYDAWEQAVFEKNEKAGCFWARNIYWYVDQYSCVLILRNRLWFSAAVPVLQQLWNTIEKERKTGFAHRAPKKKTKTAAAATAAESAGGGGSSMMEFVNVVKLTAGAIATTTTTTPYAGPGTETGTVNRTSNAAMRPSDVLIKCFKIDDLDLI